MTREPSRAPESDDTKPRFRSTHATHVTGAGEGLGGDQRIDNAVAVVAVAI